MVSVSNKPSSFLIIRLSSLGDILLTTPALRGLRNTYPDARIDVLTSARYRELLLGNTNINSLLTVEDQAGLKSLRLLSDRLQGQYQVVVDLHTSLRSFYLRKLLKARQTLAYDKRRFERWLLVNFKINRYPEHFSIPRAYFNALEPLSVKDDGLGLDWSYALENRARFLEVAALQEAPQQMPIALCPGASYPTKRWLWEYWLELALALLKQGHILWIFGDEHDAEVGEQLQALDPQRVNNFCGRLTLAESGAGLSFCRGAITNDAGPAHLAAAVQVPVVAIFGSTVPQFGFAPYGVPYRIAEITEHLPCRPCSHLGFAACPLEHHRCMKEIKPEQVLNGLDGLLRFARNDAS